jgi:uncharacterized surface protein with fasciclin (FAS1) repeats
MTKTRRHTALAGLTALTLGLVTAAAVAGYGEQKKEKDIVATAAGNEAFSTLVAAVKAADLVEALQGEGPFTVFAPTDEAFGKLPEGTLESLLQPENKAQLQAILKYHVVSGKVKAENVVELSEAQTLQGATIAINVTDDGVMLNGSTKVIMTDVMASNGVIHVIDSVLLPPADASAAVE